MKVPAPFSKVSKSEVLNVELQSYVTFPKFSKAQLLKLELYFEFY